MKIGGELFPTLTGAIYSKKYAFHVKSVPATNDKVDINHRNYQWLRMAFFFELQ